MFFEITFATKPPTMKKYTFLVLIIMLFVSNYTSATHIVGYDMTLVNIKDINGGPTHNYKWRMRFYRDVTGIPMPTNFSFKVYRNDTHIEVGSFNVVRISPSSNYLVYNKSDCAPPFTQVPVELGIYESPIFDYSSLNANAGYYVSSVNNGRGVGAVNVLGNSANYSAVFTMDFPPLAPGKSTMYNNSPEFKTTPLLHFTVGKTYQLDWSAKDADGDQLKYSIVQSLDLNNNKPFLPIPFAANYGIGINLTDGNPDFSIDSTGIITFHPTLPNRYFVAVKVEEYRNGIKIGEIRREVMIESIIVVETPPQTMDQKARTGIIRDTVYVDAPYKDYQLSLVSKDMGDSLFMHILPSLKIGENVLNPNLFNASWSEKNGTPLTGKAGENLIIGAKDSLEAVFSWRIDSSDTKDTPYELVFVSRDQTCPRSLNDSLKVYILVQGPQCYNMLNQSFMGCDSVMDFQGNVYYQSGIVMDTLAVPIGCDEIIYKDITVHPTPLLDDIAGQSTVLDTSLVYTYSLNPIPFVGYNWSVMNGTIIADNRTSIDVKWMEGILGEIKCVVGSSPLCLDSTYLSINFGGTGIENTAGEKYKIYPNPTSEWLSIEGLSTSAKTMIEIFDVQGKLQKSEGINNSERISIADLKTGVYLMKINNAMLKLIKM